MKPRDNQKKMEEIGLKEEKKSDVTTQPAPAKEMEENGKTSYKCSPGSYIDIKTTKKINTRAETSRGFRQNPKK